MTTRLAEYQVINLSAFGTPFSGPLGTAKICSSKETEPAAIPPVEKPAAHGEYY